MATVANKALSRFTSKLKSGNSALGVTLASSRQSLEMIVERTNRIAERIELCTASALHMSKRDMRRRFRKGLTAEQVFSLPYSDRMNAIRDRASGNKTRKLDLRRGSSDYLEYIFGWVPLVNDIQGAFGVLGQVFPDPRFIKGTATSYNPDTTSTVGPAYAYDRIVSNVHYRRVTVSGQAIVTNENLWLANRLGLLNLPGVAWDLIPWSFVVNMFTNMGQMVNSLTDFVGVDITQSSETRSGITTRTDSCFAGKVVPPQYPTSGSATSVVYQIKKERVLGLPRPKFQFRSPDLDAGLAAIAISLLLQKTAKLNKLIGVT